MGGRRATLSFGEAFAFLMILSEFWNIAMIMNRRSGIERVSEGAKVFSRLTMLYMFACSDGFKIKLNFIERATYAYKESGTPHI